MQEQPQINTSKITPVETSQKPRKTHRFLKILLLIVVVFCVSAGAYAYSVGSKLNAAYSKIYHKVDGQKASTAIKNKEPFTILLLGIDTGAEGRIDKGNSDTIILATVNPTKKSVSLNSIPRDTLAQMQGTKTFNMQKINAAYNIGGSKMAMKTVSEYLQVPVDYYATVNMGALADMVDAVGGVTVDVPFSFTSHHTEDQLSFEKGKQHLNGKQALTYSRMRYEDPTGDYGRQLRQRQVITAMMKSAISFESVTNFDEILKTLSDSVATNLKFSDIVNLQLYYRQANQKIKSDYLHAQGAMIGLSSYQVASTAEIQRLSDSVHQQLGLKKVTVKNAQTAQNKLNPDFKGENDKYIVYPKKDLTETIQSTDYQNDAKLSSENRALNAVSSEDKQVESNQIEKNAY